MKKYLWTGILALLLGLTYYYRNDIIRIYDENFNLTSNTLKTMLDKKNNYYRNKSFNFVQETGNFSPTSKQDIYNIYYTAINAGKEKFTFYCPKFYKECLDEVKVLANDQITLSNINNFVHPYNGFKNIETTYDETGRVTLTFNKTYSIEEISVINNKLTEIKNELYDSNLSIKDQIKKYHDYIIDNSVYDSDRSDKDIVNYKSDTAYGTLIEGHSLCGGYTDAMALLLDDLGVENYKISSERHVWNAVKLDDKWYHLDLTWDDPVTQDGTQLIEDDFFLIDNNTLFNIEKEEHNYDTNVYSEVNN